jgi:hypothetical protein
MSIEIGGAIRESDLEELLGLVTDGEIYDMYSDSPTTVSDLKRAIKAGERIEWGGTSNYGSCDDLSAWLRVHESPISSSILSDILKDTVKVMEP